MTTATHTTWRPRWAVGLLAAMVAVPAVILGFTAASASAAGVAETRVGAFDVAGGVLVEPPEHIAAGQRLGNDVAGPVFVVATGVAAESEGSAQTLFHYTTEEGQKGILDSGQLNPSLKSVNPSDARYGNGQYLTDIAPGSKTGPQLSRALLGNPFQASRFTHYLEIDVSGLDVVPGRPGVFVVPNEGPLDIIGRIIGYGTN